MPGFDLNLETQNNYVDINQNNMATYSAVIPNIGDLLISTQDKKVILSGDSDENVTVCTAGLTPLSLAGTPLIDLPDPTVAQGCATKAYVDSSKITYLSPVRALGTANISLSLGQPSGSSAGITGLWQFTQATTIDGLTIVQGNRILLTNQADATQNGVYYCSSVDSGLCKIQRPTDHATGSVIRASLRVLVTAGTSYTNKVFENTTPTIDANGLIVSNLVGTAPQNWTLVGTLSTTTLTDSGNGNALVNANLSLDTGDYRYLTGLGGNSKWFLGNVYYITGWQGVNVPNTNMGDGVALSYHVRPDKSKLSNYGATRLFVGYSYAAIQYSVANGGTTTTTTIGETIMSWDWGNARTFSMHFLPFNNTFQLGNATYRWLDVYSVNVPNSTSDARKKRDVVNIQPADALDTVMKLHPVSYKWIENSHDRRHTGFIAQQVEQDLGVQEASEWGFFIHNPAWTETLTPSNPEEKGEIVEHEDSYALRYEELISPLVGAVQCLAHRVENLEGLRDLTTPMPSLERQTAGAGPAGAISCQDCVILQSKLAALESRVQDLETYLAGLSSIFKK